jgi:hypothetical protein
VDDRADALSQGIDGVPGPIHRGTHRPDGGEQRAMVGIGDLGLEGDSVAAPEVRPGDESPSGSLLGERTEALGVVERVHL